MNTNSGLEADLQGYSPPLSLWKLVEQHVASHELDEIKSMLGAGVVDETLELHDELDAFLDIWRECRHSIEQYEKASKPFRLPEPPGMRDRLIQEINFFIENIREKAQEQGRAESASLKLNNNNIIDYAISESQASCDPISRPHSVIGHDGKETPSYRFSSPHSDRISSSSYSTMSEDVEAMADKLNILKVDEVVQHLRSHLTEEKELLVQDLRFLQLCIEEENEISIAQQDMHVEEPTIGELREERLKLEKDMLSDVFINQKSLHQMLPCLKPVSARNRTPVVPGNRPLKAVHVTAPDGIVLAGNVPESVVVKTQQKLNEYIPVQLSVDNAANESQSSDSVSAYQSTQPSSSALRPSSARRFRSMIMSARSVSS